MANISELLKPNRWTAQCQAEPESRNAHSVGSLRPSPFPHQRWTPRSAFWRGSSLSLMPANIQISLHPQLTIRLADRPSPLLR